MFAGDVEGAIASAAEAMSIKTAGDPTSEVEWVVPVAIVFAAAGRLEEAREIASHWTVMEPFGVPLTATAYLVGFGAMEVFGGDAELGLRVLGAARNAFRQRAVGGADRRGDLRAFGGPRADPRREEAATRAREEGLQMTGEEALALVL